MSEKEKESALATDSASGLIQSPESSHILGKILDQLGSMQQRLEKLEKEVREISAGRDRTPPCSSIRPPVICRTGSRPATILEKSHPDGQDLDGNLPDGKPKLCLEPGCNRLARSRGLCSAHYQRLRYRERKTDAPPENRIAPVEHEPQRTAILQRPRPEKGTRGIFALLYEEKGKRLLAGMINQMKIDRRDLVERLNKTHEGLPGIPVDEEDLLRAVHYHQLGDILRKRESEILCRHLTKQRGSLAKTAQAIKIDLEKLQNRFQELQMEEEVSRIRNEFREAILERGSFQERLGLVLGREKYLEDLGITSEVDAALRRDLHKQLSKVRQGATAEEQALSIQQALSLDEEHYRRLIKRFGTEIDIPENP
jgi:hypothetical protein